MGTWDRDGTASKMSETREPSKTSVLYLIGHGRSLLRNTVSFVYHIHTGSVVCAVSAADPEHPLRCCAADRVTRKRPWGELEDLVRS